MPANRRQRRAARARARHAPAQLTAPKSLLGRVGLGLVGALLAILGLFVIITPRSIHVGRGFFFLLIIGVALMYLAIRQPTS
jgi:hypothetical protein